MKCSCGEYPVINNIVYMKNNPSKDKALAYLSRSDVHSALLTLLDNWRLLNYIAASAPLIPLPLLLTIASLLYPSEKYWWRYLKIRPRRATYILSLSTIGAIAPRNIVVDIGCGPGHFLSKVSLWARPKYIIGIDTSFFLLYLARSYILPSNTLLVCSDIEHGLPIKNHYIDFISINDTFMSIRRKQFVLSELHRATKSNGKIFLTHVHNARQQNLGQGIGITPASLYTIGKQLFQIGMISDIDFFNNAYNNDLITYASIKSNGLFPLPSYSYQLTPTNGLIHKLKVPFVLKAHLKKTPVDYTEDEHLQNAT